jgi:pyruvate dehydrogenase E2 component (dihydrolipoamide acetyltransferase)
MSKAFVKVATMKDEVKISGHATAVSLESENPLRIPLNMTRKTMARRMEQSAREIPQFAVSVELDADELTVGRNLINATVAAGEKRVSVTAMLVWLAARAMRKHPLMNARFEQDAALLQDAVHVAVAMETPDGLKAPVIRNAGTLTPVEIARALNDLTVRASSKRLAISDFVDATFTISNLGMFGVTRFIPLVNPPQAAILGVGGLRTSVKLSEEGRLVPATTIELTVAADHRLLDGTTVAHFLQTIKEYVSQVSLGMTIMERDNQ